jgi:hypothetical protein
MNISAIIKAILLTVFIGCFTAPQFAQANNVGIDNGGGNGGHDNGGHNGNSGGGDGGGGTASVPIDGMSILLIAGVAYTGITVYRAKKRKVSLIYDLV